MAKKDKKDKKATAKKVGAAIEAKGFDVAHKIWLAGVGAYGKAYDVAAEGAGKLTGSTTDVFEELVKRGEEIENGMKSRLASNTAFTKLTEQIATAGKQINKLRTRVTDRAEDVTETVTKFQQEQRERLEARMERMRDALGLDRLTGGAKKADKVHATLDELEEQVAKLRATSEHADDAVKSRVARLSAEIAAVGGKTVKAVKADVAAVVEKTEKAKAPKKVKTTLVADENGRLAAPIGKADDLKLIKGIGAVLEQKLNAAGLFHFWQIAGLTKPQIEVLEADMSFPGRIGRDAWISQAKSLVSAN